MTNLLPCPFCGGKAHSRITIVNDEVVYVVFCMVCDASSAYHDTLAEAIAAWNCRIEPDGQLVGIAMVDHEENES